MGAIMDKQLEEYRTYLVTAQKKAQEDFDKTVLTLSGGALGISFAFVKDIIGTSPVILKELLLLSWTAWGISVACILFSFYFSNLAFRKAISQVDKNKAYDQPVGGLFSKATALLNALGAFLFLAGVVLIVIFASYNMR